MDVFSREYIPVDGHFMWRMLALGYRITVNQGLQSEHKYQSHFSVILHNFIVSRAKFKSSFTDVPFYIYTLLANTEPYFIILYLL
jgi:hypothetical protein